MSKMLEAAKHIGEIYEQTHDLEKMLEILIKESEDQQKSIETANVEDAFEDVDWNDVIFSESDDFDDFDDDYYGIGHPTEEVLLRRQAYQEAFNDDFDDFDFNDDYYGI